MNDRFNPIWFLVPVAILIFVDIYVFQSVRSIFAHSKTNHQKIAYTFYWALSSITYIAFILLLTKDYYTWHGWDKNLLVGFAQLIFLGKLFVLPFLLIDDIVRLIRWIFSWFATNSISTQPNGISRLQFLNKMGLIVGSMMSGALLYGILRGAYNFKVRKIKLEIPNLPEEWKGLKIVQFSDLHIGSFANEKPVQKIVDLINQQEADIVFFTGDLVNNLSGELQPYISILKEIKVKTKIYSILGNHDYGHYKRWDSKEEMKANFNNLLKIQKEDLGWDLLLDENRILERNGKKLAIIGVQYIGHSLRFAQIGNLAKAYEGAQDAEVQLLLSHDPTHWDKEISINKDYQKIQATFAGHTHGFQFGIEIPGIKWSPAKYMYPHWAGLYKNKHQYLYVNRGAGFLGYPGRLGISPEITVFQLA